ncbi:transketolase C-terminal domain-containing protein, partial [Thermoproteota archaeon]
ETSLAWSVAVERKGPTVIALTRQKLPILDPKKYPIKEGVPRGAYILSTSKKGKTDLIIMATGSEVHLALAAKNQLKKKGINTMVVSMPSWELFEEQSEEYKKNVFPSNIPKIALEAGIPLGWHKYVGLEGDIIGLNRFGASAPGQVVYEKLGFNLKNIMKHALELLKK